MFDAIAKVIGYAGTANVIGIALRVWGRVFAFTERDGQIAKNVEP